MLGLSPNDERALVNWCDPPLACLPTDDVCSGRSPCHPPLTAPCGCGIRGGALCLRAKLLAQSGVEAEAVKMLQLAAVKKFEAAVEINPQSTQALRSWGLALQDAAELTPHDAADAIELLSQVRVACTLMAVSLWQVECDLVVGSRRQIF